MADEATDSRVCISDLESVGNRRIGLVAVPFLASLERILFAHYIEQHFGRLIYIVILAILVLHGFIQWSGGFSHFLSLIAFIGARVLVS